MRTTSNRSRLVAARLVRSTPQALAALPESDFVAACDVDLPTCDGIRHAVWREAIQRRRRDARRMRRSGSLDRDAAPAARRAGDRGGQRRRACSGRKTAGGQPGRLRRDARRGRASGIKLGVISQRRLYEPVQRMKAAIDAGKIGRPVLGVFVMYSWREPAYYQSDPWRGRWDTEGGGVLVNQSPHMIDLLKWLMDDEVAEVSGYWANLNHPSVPRRRYGRGHSAVPEWRPGVDRHQRFAKAWDLYQGAYSWIKWCVGWSGDRPRRDLHRGSFDYSRTVVERPVDHPRRGRSACAIRGRGPGSL